MSGINLNMYNTNVESLKMLIFNDNDNECKPVEINKKHTEETAISDSKKFSIKKINEITRSLRDSEKIDTNLLKRCIIFVI
jgi:hypothetical protein